MQLEEKQQLVDQVTLVETIESPPAETTIVSDPEEGSCPALAGDPPLTIAKYPCLEVLSSSEHAIVYRSVMPGTGKPIVLKSFNQNFTGDPVRSKRFCQDAEMASRLNHPSTVSLYDWGVADGKPYVVTDVAQGLPLSEILSKEGYLDAGEVSEYGKQICEALTQIHSAGITHGNLKPENIFIAKGDKNVFVKVSDFGLPLDEKCTRLDAKSDLRALGAVLYQALVGRAAPQADVPSAADLGIRVPKSVEKIVFRCLSEKRYQSAAEVAAALDGAQAELLFDDGEQEQPADKKAEAKSRRRKKLRRRVLRFVAVTAGLLIVSGAVQAVRYMGHNFNQMALGPIVDCGQVYTPSEMSWERLRTLGEHLIGDGRYRDACNVFSLAIEKVSEKRRMKKSDKAEILSGLRGSLGNGLLLLAAQQEPVKPAPSVAKQMTDPLLLAAQEHVLNNATMHSGVPGHASVGHVSAAFDPRSASNATFRANLQEAENNLSMAVRDLKKFNKLGPQHRDILEGLADVHYAQGRFAESMTERQDLLKMAGDWKADKDFIARQSTALGATMIRQGQLGEATPVLREALASFPPGADQAQVGLAYSSLESALVGQKRFGEAERLVQRHMKSLTKTLGETSYPYIEDELRLAHIWEAQQKPEGTELELKALHQLRQRLAEH